MMCYTIQAYYMSLFLSKKRDFAPAQIERIANILDNLGQVFFAVMVLTPIMQGIDNINLIVLILGAVDVIICWTGSVLLAERRDQSREGRDKTGQHGLKSNRRQKNPEPRPASHQH